MATRRTEAERLRSKVIAERERPPAERSTGASDPDLALVEALLESAAGAESPTERQSLRGRISHVVVDTWSFAGELSEELVSFDDRYLIP